MSEYKYDYVVRRFKPQRRTLNVAVPSIVDGETVVKFEQYDVPLPHLSLFLNIHKEHKRVRVMYGYFSTCSEPNKEDFVYCPTLPHVYETGWNHCLDRASASELGTPEDAINYWWRSQFDAAAGWEGVDALKQAMGTTDIKKAFTKWQDSTMDSMVYKHMLRITSKNYRVKLSYFENYIQYKRLKTSEY